jgi:hypothetical protein
MRFLLFVGSVAHLGLQLKLKCRAHLEF